MEKFRVGMIGVGKRGVSLMAATFATEDANVTAVCDLYPDRVENAVNHIKEKYGIDAKGFVDYKELLADKDIDAVIVSSSWESHSEIAIAAMKAGKPVGIEVGGAYSIDECWELVKTYEETKTPFMFMENCCFDEFELLATSLVRAGKLGTIVHCHGAYSHDLRDEILGGNVNRHYRLRNYMNRCCENYPTHELGPIAKILNINRGNRMLSLVSVASKSAGLEAFAKTDKNPDPSLVDARFAQGDIVTTIIKCAGGETITLTLDTSLPKYYSREFTVRGTKGLSNQEALMVSIEGECNNHNYWDNVKNTDKYVEYLPRIWRDITPEERELGHGGMDYMEFKAFFTALREGKEPPIDVYDAAAWMCISALSEASIAAGGAPQTIPDFTNGKWILRKPLDVTEMPEVK